MEKGKGSGSLFQEDAHGIFMRLTGSRYENMDNRMERKKLPPLPFSKANFRSHILSALRGQEDGFVRCRYCLGFFALKEITADHAIPLSRGGSTALDNIEYPCQPCNQQKGSLTPTEFLDLLKFLEEKLPMGRKDVLSRLQMSVTLAAGAAATRGVIGKLKASGQWKSAQSEMRANKKAKESGLGPF